MERRKTKRTYPLTGEVEVGAEDLISMAFNSTKYNDTLFGFQVPQTECVIFTDGQQQMTVSRMDLDLIYRIPVS